MAHTYAAIDISTAPDTLKLAAKVQRTQTPRLLRRADEDLAILIPVASRKRSRRLSTDADITSAWATFGS